MLGEVTSEEISEWQAYFSVKENQEKDNVSAREAKERARKQGR